MENLEKNTQSMIDTRWTYVCIVLIGLIIFLNEATYVQPTSYEQWLVKDYSVRVLVLLIVFGFPSFRRQVATLFRLNVSVGRLVIIAIGIPAIDFFLHYVLIGPIAFELFPKPPFIYPKSTPGFLHGFDLTVGLVLVAVSEETIFRVVLPKFIERFTTSRFWIVLISSFLFSAVHWTNGVGNSVEAFLIGIVFILSIYWSGSVVPAMLGHYLTDLFYFW